MEQEVKDLHPHFQYRHPNLSHEVENAEYDGEKVLRVAAVK
jgi:hypothetical protein